MDQFLLNSTRFITERGGVDTERPPYLDRLHIIAGSTCTGRESVHIVHERPCGFRNERNGDERKAIHAPMDDVTRYGPSPL